MSSAAVGGLAHTNQQSPSARDPAEVAVPPRGQRWLPDCAECLLMQRPAHACPFGKTRGPSPWRLRTCRGRSGVLSLRVRRSWSTTTGQVGRPRERFWRSTMILCTDCGEQNELATVFCTRCGVFLEWEGERVNVPASDAAVSRGAALGPSASPGSGFVPLPAPEPRLPDGVTSRQRRAVRRRSLRLVKWPVIVPTGSRICGGCGMPNQSTRLFCAKCGFSMVDARVVREMPRWRRLLWRARISCQ